MQITSFPTSPYQVAIFSPASRISCQPGLPLRHYPKPPARINIQISIVLPIKLPTNALPRRHVAAHAPGPRCPPAAVSPCDFRFVLQLRAAAAPRPRRGISSSPSSSSFFAQLSWLNYFKTIFYTSENDLYSNNNTNENGV